MAIRILLKSSFVNVCFPFRWKTLSNCIGKVIIQHRSPEIFPPTPCKMASQVPNKYFISLLCGLKLPVISFWTYSLCIFQALEKDKIPRLKPVQLQSGSGFTLWLRGEKGINRDQDQLWKVEKTNIENVAQLYYLMIFAVIESVIYLYLPFALGDGRR